MMNVITGLSTKEWEAEVSLLGLDQKAEILLGLKALYTWAIFEKNFDWTGIFEIKSIIERSIEK